MAEMKVRPERMFEVAPAEFRADGADAASDSDGCDGGEFSDEKKIEGRMCLLWLVVWEHSLHGQESWWQDHMEDHIVSVVRKPRETCFLLFIQTKTSA